MIIADRLKIKAASILSTWATSRFIKAGLLLCFAFFSIAFGKIGEIRELTQAQSEFDGGNYTKAIELAGAGIEKAKNIKNSPLISEGLDIAASSQISLGRYDDAVNTLNEALRIVSDDKKYANQKALIYIRFSWLLRSQRKSSEAFDYSKKAVAAAPDNRHILAEHYLGIGRILFSSGYDVSAIVWLEKAEKLLEAEKINSAKLDVFRFLTLAWSSKLNYQTALKYAEKGVLSAENTRFKYKLRQALFDQATTLSASGQKNKAFLALEKGLKLSDEENDSYQGGKFLTSLLLHALDEGNTIKAPAYLARLENLNTDSQFSYEIKLGKAVISAFQGQVDDWEKLFAELEKQENTSRFILLYWKIAVAEKHQDWERIINLNQELLEITTKNNFREDFPGIYLNFAKAHYRLNQTQKASEYLEKSLSFIEEIRNSENQNLSLGLLETYHNAYRLLAQIKSEKAQESFELSDFLKARLLKDRINDSAAETITVIPVAVRQKLEELSVKFIDDPSLADEIEKNEKLVTNRIPDLNLVRPNLAELDKISSLNDTAVISYFFTFDKNLMAFVWEKEKPLQMVNLPISEDEIETIAKTTQQNIKNRVFFKRDGKVIYDKLLKPLPLTAKHIIIVPDKSLWKIPFQALSSDGEKYLIEEKLISYAPSVSILLEQLKNPKPIRQTLLAFANSTYENKALEYVNSEATKVAEIYSAKPFLNAAVSNFEMVSEKADILHFSMHAQVDNEQPLDSFLGFRKFGKDDGRLTVEELLSIKLKKRSLVFLASCDTNNVLNGEGLVSLAWAMMGSGATTVISAQWEANDKSTGIFTKAFYNKYKQGGSSAEALQKAALELIRNKSNNMHEPYYWADFTLNGDYR